MSETMAPARPGEAQPLPPGTLWSSVGKTAARACREGTPVERLRGAVEAAASRAFEACGRRDCAACDRLWSGRDLPCEKRQVRSLAKHLAKALLPFLAHGRSFDALRSDLDGAAAQALGREEVS